MNALIVFAHPELRSFNGAMKDVAIKALSTAGYKIRVSDLYSMGFDPVSDRRNFTTVKDPDYYKQQVEEMYAHEHGGFAEDVQEEMDKLNWCDLLVFQFPLWWFGLPAVLKGWCDRVLAMGLAYGPSRRYDTGMFLGKKGLLAVTTGGGPDTYSQFGKSGYIHDILQPINHGIFYFTGITPVEPFIVHEPARLTDETRTAELERYRQYLLNIASAKTISYPGSADYDEKNILKTSAPV